MDQKSSAKADNTFDGSGKPIKSDGDSTAQSNDGGEVTDQQTGGPSTGADPGGNDINDQSQNRQQTDANLEAQQNRQAGEIDDPNNPAVETRPPEQTAPNEETPGYEPKNQ
jgi:hypothetical protein